MRLLRHLLYLLNVPPRRQTCKDCWRSEGLDFHVPTVVWNRVMAPHSMLMVHDASGFEWGGVVCLACFDRRAEIREVDYSGDLAIMGRHAWLACGKAAERVRAAT